jgi:hypothetical protein
MHHLVHQHPIVAQLIGSDVATELQPDERHGRAIRRSMSNTIPVANDHVDAKLLGGELAVIARHDGHRAPDPGNYRHDAVLEFRRLEIDADTRSLDLDRACGRPVGRERRETAEEQRQTRSGAH